MANWIIKTIETLVRPHGADVTLEFTSDETPPRTSRKKFSVRNREDLERQAHAFQLKLASDDLLPQADDTVVPKAPNPVDQAIESARLAVRKLGALDRYLTVSGKTDVAVFGSTTITVAAVRLNLIAAAEADITSAARLSAFLENI